MSSRYSLSARVLTFKTRYYGSPVVNRSIEMDQPVVFVSMNYRLSGNYQSICSSDFELRTFRFVALGFLASQEVKDAGVGNLGLYDRELI